ncbi:glycosyltransferase family 4 protein [Candidatus Uhrbacteria bacterium]|nr:glycosyltransferase family 4 protein [Candidatus Uhrbacteria bacterium]
MRIAYLSCVYPPYPGGIGVLAHGMAHEIAERGYTAEVFTLRSKGLEQAIAQEAGLRSAEGPAHTPAKVKVNFINTVLRYGHAGWAPNLARQLSRFDTVHLLYPFFGVAEIIPYLRARTKSKIVVHHTMDAMAEGVLGMIFRLYNQTLMPRIFKQAHLIITLSEDYFRECDLTSVYAAMPASPPIEFIPNGVDTKLFRPTSQSVISTKRPMRARGEISHATPDNGVEIPRFARNDKSVPIILFASGLDRAHYFKGVHVLIEAVRILKQRKVPCRGWIIGSGKMQKEYEAHARVAGVLNAECGIKRGACQFPEAHLEFLGLAHHQDMPDYYRQAAVAVVPSTARVECFSIVAAEAQACGVPAIVSDFPGVRVTVEDGKTGYVVRPGDPEALADRIGEVIKNPEKSHAMGIAARKRAVELYDWKIIGDKLEKIYKSI